MLDLTRDMRQIRTFTPSAPMHKYTVGYLARLGHNRRDQLREVRLITARRPADRCDNPVASVVACTAPERESCVLPHVGRHRLTDARWCRRHRSVQLEFPPLRCPGRSRRCAARTAGLAAGHLPSSTTPMAPTSNWPCMMYGSIGLMRGDESWRKVPSSATRAEVRRAYLAVQAQAHPSPCPASCARRVSDVTAAAAT
jgi:hypothetical protein